MDREMPADTCVLGVDGGGTHTVSVILDASGRAIGRGLGGPSNHQSVGEEAARKGLAEAVAAARSAAGDPPLAAACLGMSGLDREEDLTILRRMAEAVLPGLPVQIVNDAEIALVGGTSGRREGIVVIAGTGSIAVGIDARGRTARAGGWGHLLGDEGSGYDLGRQALNAATRARDGRGPKTSLMGRLPATAGVPDLEGLAHCVYSEGWTAPEVAALAPAVLEAAEEGDEVAQGIVDTAAHELALAAIVVIRVLGMEQQAFEVVLSGGIFGGSPRMVGAARREVEAFAPKADTHLPRSEPVLGAAWMASQTLGRPTPAGS
jgi:N-acetylglucosamine kinase-like BadF-type ATPase